jgi:hypothetical protein
MKTFISFFTSLLIALFVGVGVSIVVPVSPMVAGGTFFVARATYFFINSDAVKFPALFAGVNKEIWIDKLKENFYSAYEWLNGVEDWSQWVEFNTINFTVAGGDPVILKNNSSWPIVAAQRTDTNSTVVLDTYDSTTTRVRNVEEIESVIDKLESVVRQHRSKLMQEIVTECLWNYAPATAAAGNIAATGANRSVVIGSQSTVASTLTLQDIASLQERWDAMDAPLEGRTLVLNPYHRRDLMAQDITLFKSFTDLKAGQALPLFGINVYVAANTPLFTKSTLAKKAYGAAADNTNDCIGSVAFINSEVMKAMGDVEMFYKEKGINPEQRADEVGFQVRFKGVPQRSTNFMQQAIVSSRA